MIKLVIAGALGRMGQALIKAASQTNFKIIGGLISSRPHQIIPPTWDFPVMTKIDDLASLVEPGSVIIDFSHYSQTASHLSFAQTHKCKLLIGSTGHPDENLVLIKQHARHSALLLAPNTSIMANLLIKLSEISTQALPSCQIHIVEMHHQYKQDAPSGTARALQQAVGRPCEVSSLRLGDIAGEHSVYLVNNHERLELTHRVHDRIIFAQGALFAANFLSEQGPGLYDMADVINLNLTIKNRG